MPVPTPTPSPTYAHTGDGVLRIGTLFPTSGTFAFIGPSEVAGVETAVREINEAGGVNGVPVEVFHRNSGDASTQTAEASLADLVAKGVDVVIGPSSSVLAERLLAPAQAAGIPMISPAATFPDLTALKDDGLISRTSPAYALQGGALAAGLTEANATKVAYLYQDGDLGVGLLESLTKGLDSAGIALAYSGKFSTTTTDFADVIAKATKAGADAVVVSTPSEAVEQTKTLITGLSAAGLGGAKLWLTSQNLADYSQSLPGGLLNGAHGVLEGAHPDDAFSARLRQADPSLGNYSYAAEAYDATILAALSAIIGNDDGGAAVARNLRSVSTGGIKCTSFGECLDVLTTETDVDYDGISGPVNLTKQGDVTSGSFGIYVYGAGNTYTLARVVIAS
jgi:branched-chain amino acid transport system substrate-binding protein